MDFFAHIKDGMNFACKFVNLGILGRHGIMATHKTAFAGLLGALAFVLMAGLPTSAMAYYSPYDGVPNCDYSNYLPCVDYGVNDDETSVEAALLDVFGYFVDVMKIDKADGTPRPGNSTVYGSNGLSVKGTIFNGDNEGIYGTFKYTGSSDIAYVTIKAGNSYVIYDYAELVKDGVNNWSTKLLNWKGLSHLTIWKVVDNHIPEPAPLGLMLMGITYLAWRRGRKARTLA